MKLLQIYNFFVLQQEKEMLKCRKKNVTTPKRCDVLFSKVVIRMVKPSGINSVKFQRDKALIINTIYSLTHFLYFWVVEPW